MKPLTLVMSAFGPFADEVKIDFTKLGNCGLYLVTGDTGAGKTTIFDAISYALYGATSGDFRDGKMLRSKYASLDRLTYVELEFEARGQKYVVKRIPDQTRAKLRGEGETSQKAEVTLMYPDGRPPVTKIGEVDAAVKEIVGLDRKQFSQITMLAQGEFRKMLLSDTDEKQKIFRDIFSTEDYEILQKNISDRCSDKKNEYEQRRGDILRNITLLECGDDFVEKEELREFQTNGQLVQREEFKDLMDRLLSTDKETVDSYGEQLKELEDVLQHLNAQIGVATQRQKSVQELHRVERELVVLKDSKEVKEVELKKTEKELQDADVLNATAVRIETKLSDYNQYTILNRDIQNKQRNVQEIEQQQENRSNTLLQLEKDEKHLNEIVENYKEADVRILECEQSLKTAQERKREVEVMQQDYSRGLQTREKLKQKQLECQGKTQELEQKSKSHAENERLFYNAQAGILAETLIVGEPCPVCGSIEHPSPAVKIAEVLTKEQLDQEARLVEAVREQCQVVSNAVVQLQEQLDQQDVQYKDKALRLFDKEEVKQGQLEEECARLTDQITEVSKLLQQWKNAKVAFDKARTDLPLLAEQYKQLNGEFQTAEQEKVAYQTELKKLLEQAAIIKEGLQFEGVEQAQKEINRLRTHANSLVEAQKKAAIALQEIQQKLSEQEGQKQSIEKLLSSQPADDLTVLVGQRTKVMQDKQHKEEVRNLVVARYNRNSTLSNAIYTEWCSFDSFEQEYLELKQLSDTMNGGLTGKDKIKLETYIQMAYFERVLQKANVRLLGMTGGQYELVRSTQADDLRSQSGLDINVYDYYNSSERSVRSLSGGESFMASLALALGLADEIQSTAGGIHIDTLFVDEGFGSLDEETLKRAMMELNKLTEGNRLVGVISHVTDLKNWIDKQIVVTKVSHQGSNVAMVV